MPGSALMGHARRYRLLAFAVLLALTLPRMTGRTMFGDGMLYAAVARNMSVGEGTLWQPSFSETAYREFFEHPPLGFGLQAIAFWIAGDHLIVERGYSLAMFGLQAVLIVAIWRRLMPASHDWLPLFFWVAPSIVTWAAINNMLENTQAVLTTAAVYLLLRAVAARGAGQVAGWAIAAGLSVIVAVLTKGPVGFFPLVVPILALLLPGPPRPSQLARVSGFLLGTVFLLAVALVSYRPAHRAIVEYVEHQLAPSLAGLREVNNDPLAAAKHLGFGIMGRMIVMALAVRLAGRRGDVGDSWRVATFLLAVACAASLPIAISPKVLGHYFLPSVPMYALAAAAFAWSFLRSSAPTFAPSTLGRLAPTALGATLFVTAIGMPLVHGPIRPRDVTLLASLDAIDHVVPQATTVGACTASGDDWRLRTYMNRFFRVSIDTRDQPVNGWFLRTLDGCQAPASCTLAVDAAAFGLFDCRGSAAH
jgi:4-amino-4-deoxy-L-arabinose transferase-like glycosyltransferase